MDFKQMFIFRIYGFKVLNSGEIILFQGPLAVAVPGEIDGYYQVVLQPQINLNNGWDTGFRLLKIYVCFVHNNPDAEAQRSYAQKTTKSFTLQINVSKVPL